MIKPSAIHRKTPPAGWHVEGCHPKERKRGDEKNDPSGVWATSQQAVNCQPTSQEVSRLAWSDSPHFLRGVWGESLHLRLATAVICPTTLEGCRK
jgi:hypothetical protein